MISQWQLKDINIKPLLNSSKDLNIVVFVGVTGAGKSTVMNFVNNKKLLVNDNREIELENPNDASAMTIGMGGKSETLLPKLAKIGQLTFYELPGFFDNRGVAQNLINASLIKSILEGAKTARLVFVVGEDQITANRGQSFKNLLDISANMLPGSNAIHDSSMLIVTKSLKTNSNELIGYLKKKIDCQEKMKIWLNPDRIQPMSRMIDAQQRNDILKKIQDTVPCKIANVNIEGLYNIELRNDLKKIFEVEMQSSFEKIFNNYPKNQQTIQLVNQSIQYFLNSFQKDIIQDLQTLTIIQLLKPQSESIYQEEFNRLLININVKKSFTISQLENTKKKLEREEQSKKTAELQRQNQRQIEKQRQDQEQLEEYNRRQRIYEAQQYQLAQEAQIEYKKLVQLKQIEDDRLQKEQAERYRRLQAQLEYQRQEDLKQKELIRIQNENEKNRQRQYQAQQEQIRQEQNRIQRENERNRPENWPREVQSRRDHEIYWDQRHYYGPWCDRKGFFNSGSKRKVFVKEIRVTLVSERSVGVKPITRQVYVIQDWEQVSRSEEPTGETKFIKWQKD